MSAALIACFSIMLAGQTANADDRKWELDAHGVFAAPAQPSTGIALLGDPSLPTGSVPTWFFGDGAVLLARVSQSVRVPTPATLDNALRSAFTSQQSGGGFGVRVSRTITPRWSLELSVDDNLVRTRVESASRTALDQAGAGFSSAFNALLASPNRQAVVTSASSIDDGRGRQLLTTGAVTINVVQRGRLTPYVTAGAGALIAQHQWATAQLVGQYRFSLPVPPGLPIPVPTIHETDTVTVLSRRASGLTALYGGGFRYAAGSRWGLRADIRDHVSANKTTTIVAATPTADRGSSSAVVTLFGFTSGVSVQMSTVQGIPSTLSGNLSDKHTFRGTGTVHQINASGGVYWRF